MHLLVFFLRSSLYRFKLLAFSLAFSLLLAQEAGAWWGSCHGKGHGEGCSAFCKCASGLSCQPGVHRCYHVPRRLHEPCVVGHPCAPGFSCEAFYHKCYHRPRREGEPCNAYSACQFPLICRGENIGLTGRCRPWTACHWTRPGFILLNICV